jgi:hypothetical protein
MVKKKAWVSSALAATYVGASLLLGMMAMPTASADNLPNGLTVDCTQDSDQHSTCIVGGCPRVNGDYVVDALHLMYDGGGQQEFGFKCINGETRRVGSLGTSPELHFGVQACRKKDLEGDWCTPYAHYDFAPAPKAAPAPVEEKKPETPAVVQPVPCPAGSVTASVIPPAACEAIPAPDANSVTMTASKSGGSVNVSFKNTSNVLATCEYTAAPVGNPLLPTINKTVKVAAKGSGALNGEPAPPIFTTYNLTANCTGIFNGSEVPLGSPSTSVSG